MRLQGKTAIVTGGASGIGRATARRFADEGANVIVADIDGEAARGVASKAPDAGSIEGRHLDVTDSAEFRQLAQDVDEGSGLDILINNAGVSHEQKAIESISKEERDKVLDVNINGVWNGCQAVLDLMKEQGSGAIVNTASVGGVLGAPNLSAYSMSKGAVVQLTRTIAAEAGPEGVRANAVCPALTKTPLAKRNVDTEREWGELSSQVVEAYPMRRLGKPADIASAILFLASDEADWITGQALMVDGGFSCV
jgi:NAD(P)-dependent dehydrogenase (short-subunit alcohol dehydrogenase family)